MQVILYTNTADPRKLNKSGSLTLVKSISDAVVKTPTENVQTPILDISYFSGFDTVNYVYITDFDRYYFVSRADVATGGRVILSLSVDVLMSFAAEIGALTALLTRTAKGEPTYFDDKNYPLMPYKETKVIEFSGGDFNIESATANSYNFILQIAGGGTSENESEGE